MRALGLLLAVAALLSSANAHALPGDPDATFGGGDGKVTYAYMGQNDYVRALAQQKDGKTVAAGTTYLGAAYSMAVLRLEKDGSLDSGFGAGGKVISTTMNGANAVAIQDDGKIVVAGYQAADIVIARLTTSGTPDLTFGVGGKVSAGFDGGAGPVKLEILPDGRILVAGDQLESENILIARFLSNGDPDPSFGTGGKVVHDVALQQTVSLNSMTVLPNGKIAVAGYVTDDDGNYSILTAVFLAGGTPDAGFGPNGVRVNELGNGKSYAVDIASYPPNRMIVICNSVGVSSQSHYALLLLGPTGLVEGSEITDINTDARPKAGAVRADGKIVVVGSHASSFGIYQYTSSLQLDPSFAGDGVATVDMGSGIDTAEAVLVQSDGKILAAGSAPQTPPLSAPDFAFARVQGVGAALLADDFGNGVVTWSQASGSWSESVGVLSTSTASTAGVKAPKPWSPSGLSSCSECTILTSFGYLAGATNTKITLVAWRQSGASQVQLQYSHGTGRWILKQRANGTSVRRHVKHAISQLYPHDVALSYSGGDILFMLDGKALLRMPAVAAPSGNFGFRIQKGALAVPGVLVY